MSALRCARLCPHSPSTPSGVATSPTLARAAAFCSPYLRHLVDVANAQLWLLALRLGPKDALKRLRRQQVDGPARGGVLPDERHGQLVLAHDKRVRVLLGLDHGVAELLQLALANDARVAEPAAVGLDTRHGARRQLGLERRRTQHLDATERARAGSGVGMGWEEAEGEGEGRKGGKKRERRERREVWEVWERRELYKRDGRAGRAGSDRSDGSDKSRDRREKETAKSRKRQKRRQRRTNGGPFMGRTGRRLRRRQGGSRREGASADAC